MIQHGGNDDLHYRRYPWGFFRDRAFLRAVSGGRVENENAYTGKIDRDLQRENHDGAEKTGL